MGGRGASSGRISFKQAVALGKEQKTLNRQLSAANRTLERKKGESNLIQRKTLYPDISTAERKKRLDKLDNEIKKYENKASGIEKKINQIDKKLGRYRKQGR